MLLLSHISRVRLCATPQMAAHPGSCVPGLLQARTLERVAISFSNTCMLSCFSRVWLCVTPLDSSPPGSPIHRILQARILEWVAISFSPFLKLKKKKKKKIKRKKYAIFFFFLIYDVCFCLREASCYRSLMNNHCGDQAISIMHIIELNMC